MKTKTPQFDHAIDEILKDLKPHKRTCNQCQQVFNIFEQDIEFYKVLRVPPPTLCPSCRLQRRLAWRINFLPIFYKRKCDALGHNENIIAFYSPENPVKVYDDEYYFSDKWDALHYGRDYDFSRPFFEQFNEFRLNLPHQSLFKDPKSINCDYVVSGRDSKNCFYVAVPYLSENVYYAYVPTYSKDCLDIQDSDYCEQCYEGVFLDHCYNCAFSQECISCLDSYFLFDCRNCQNCFACTNLRNKNYWFFNKPLTKEEYFKKLKEINLGKRSVLEEYRVKFEQLIQKAIRKNLNNIQTQNSLGNDLKKCRDSFYAFRVLKDSENLRYVVSVDKVKDIMDFYGGTNNSWVYESTGIGFGNMVRFSSQIRTGLELEYCSECNDCENCFACFALRDKKYCIFNKQYSKDEYWDMVDKIKTDMLKRGEYGEFFPLKYSPYPYNDSNAQIEFPLSKEQALEQGLQWQEKVKDYSEIKGLKAEEVADDIAEVSDDILDKVIICEQTGRPFRITGFELEFYRKKKLPLPVIHPLQRIRNRLALRHPYKLWQYPCSNCAQKMYSGWDPERKLKVYCEKCYLKQVI